MSAITLDNSKAGAMPVVALAGFNLVFYLVRSAVTGDIINDGYERNFIADELNAASPLLNTMTLVACMIGMASGLAGLLHYKEWNRASRLVALGVGVISCMLDFLVFGLAVKQWDLGHEDLGDRQQFVGASAVITVVVQILYVMSVYRSSPEKH